jgi:hypothetical protein
MVEEYNILVLSCVGGSSSRTSQNHSYCYQRFAPQHNYIFHRFGSPATDALKKIRFHAIIIDNSILGLRYSLPSAAMQKVIDDYSFIRYSEAVKIALPQDEYNESEILDEWLSYYRIDILYSIFAQNLDVIYPRTLSICETRQALTGYVDDERDVGKSWKPMRHRPIDIGYRVRRMPPYWGRHGLLKGMLADSFVKSVQGKNIRADISDREEDFYWGEEWMHFLGECRFVLGCEGGTSLYDPRGEIRDRVTAFVKENPDAGFEEIEAACFPGLDQKYTFSAISPRLFEAAAAGCAQILVRAPYLTAILPGQHYICVEPDLSNVEEVVDQISDLDAARRMAEATYDALIATDLFRYSRFVSDVMNDIERKVVEKGVRGSCDAEFQSLKSYHETALGVSRQARRYQKTARMIPRSLRSLLPPSLKPLVRRLIAGRVGRAIPG